MTSHGNGQRYSVHISSNVSSHLKQLHLYAAALEKGHAFLDAFRQIVRRLQEDPLTFGEPAYSLPALAMQIRKGIVLPLVVEYGVHIHKPLVFIRGFKVL